MQELLEQKKTRLESYYERERQILSKDGVKSYGIGSRNLTRYDTALNDIRKAIADLENEIAELENALANGGRVRRSFRAVPHGNF